MPNGLVVVARWSLRLAGAVYDTVARDLKGTRVVVRPYISESGGELAHATWADGGVWNGELGTLDLLTVSRAGASRQHVVGRLASSPYGGVSDASGRMLIRDLVPGPYQFFVLDSVLAPLNLRISTDLRMISRRDSQAIVVKVPSAEEFVLDRCNAENPGEEVSEAVRVIARVMTADGGPVNDAHWGAWTTTDPLLPTDAWTVVKRGARTGSDGIITICSYRLRRNGAIEISIGHDGFEPVILRRTTASGLNVFPIFLRRKS
jgi:hypothetical protein